MVHCISVNTYNNTLKNIEQLKMRVQTAQYYLILKTAKTYL